MSVRVRRVSECLGSLRGGWLCVSASRQSDYCLLTMRVRRRKECVELLFANS